MRAEAAERGLLVADKPDSHDICFIPSGDTRRFLTERIGVRPGAIVDSVTGERLADHEGVHGFTVGQRKGLGVDAPADDGRPRYVTAIEPATGTVRVGPATALDVRSIDGVAPVWAAGAAPGESFDCTVQVRAHGGLAPAAVRVTAERRVDRAGRAAARGRAGADGAFYADDVVLGSARIAATAA